MCRKSAAASELEDKERGKLLGTTTVELKGQLPC